jgi:ABC-type sugar transport system ATPase subunit
MCARIIVIHERTITGQLDDIDNTTQEDILSLAMA